MFSAKTVQYDRGEAHLRRSGPGETPDGGRRKLSGLYTSFSGGGSFICGSAAAFGLVG